MSLKLLTPILIAFMAGCTVTHVRLASNQTYSGALVSMDDESVEITTEDAMVTVRRSEIRSVRHPGSARITGGALLAAGSIIGAGFTAQLLGSPFVETEAFEPTGDTREEGECGLCALGLISIPMLSIGASMLFRGIALRRDSVRQLRGLQGSSGAAHIRIGAALLVSSAATLAWLPAAIVVDDGPLRGAGIGALMLGSALLLPGIFLLARGQRMRNTTRLRLTARGIEF